MSSILGAPRPARRRRSPIVALVAFGLTALVVVGAGIALTGPLQRVIAPDQVPASGGSLAALGSSPSVAPAWSPRGALPACKTAAGAPAPPARARVGRAQMVREVDTQGSRVGRPAGITYSPAARLLMLFAQGEEDPPPGTVGTIGMITLFSDAAGSAEIQAPILDAANATFDGVGGRLLLLDPRDHGLLSVPASVTGDIDRRAEQMTRYDLRPLGLGVVGGSATDPADGALYLLDPANDRVMRIGADQDEAGNTTPSLRDGGVCTISLEAVPDPQPRGIAAEPVTGHLFVLGSQSRRLFEIDAAGRLFAIRDLSALGVGEPRAMVFAPTGDPTDEEASASLYLVDHVAREASGEPARDRVIELRLEAGPSTAVGPAPARDVHAVLVRTIHTSAWSVSSPDPSGIAYVPGEGLLVGDAEVDETPEFAGANLYEASPAGLLKDSSITAFSREPSGLAVDPGSGRRFVTDDVTNQVFVVEPGEDGIAGTGDDDVSAFDTAAFGCFDPEGVAFGQGRLFIADGLGAEVYNVAPGANGVFDGVAPEGDDEVTHFDTRPLGQPTPEGIEFLPERGTLLVVSNDRRANLLEVTTAGKVVRIIDLSFMNAIAPGGLAHGPGSDAGAGASIFIADRGIDNARDPSENDGRIYELRIVSGPPPNLVLNPGMERDEDGDGLVDGWDNEPGVSASRDNARSGDTALRLEAPAAGVVVAQNVPSIAGNRNYTFITWLDIPPADAVFDMRVRVRWREVDGTTLLTQKVAVLEESTSGWDKFTAALRSPPRATHATISFALEGTGTVVYVDDVFLVPVALP